MQLSVAEAAVGLGMALQRMASDATSQDDALSLLLGVKQQLQSVQGAARSVGSGELTASHEQLTAEALTTLQRLPPPKRRGSDSAREERLAVLAAQISRCREGRVVMAALESRGLSMIVDVIAQDRPGLWP